MCAALPERFSDWPRVTIDFLAASRGRAATEEKEVEEEDEEEEEEEEELGERVG